MLNKIIGFAVANKLLVGLLVLALVAYGSYELTRLPIDAVPDITNNQVQVITVAPSFGATDIERLVTFPIEQANSNIAGLEEIRSFSRFGLSLVTIVFDDQTDIYWARQQVSERLLKVQSQIPQGIGTPELGPISTGLGEIYQYVVRPKPGYEHRYDETQLRTIQDWIVRRQLLGVKGVAEVSSFGGKLMQYTVEVNPDKLLSYGVTIGDVFSALEANNQNTGGAYIEKGPTVLYIRSEGLVESLADIGEVSVKNLADGQPLLIRDLAEVKTGFATRYGAMCYNDQGEVSGAVVMMLKGANSSEVIRNVKERVAQIQKTLPEGVVIEPFLDRTKMVNNAIGTVEKNLLEGALIVVFVLVLFLGNLRAGLLVASVIPLSMLFAVIMMNTFGVSGNLMSLGALDFGLIVDGAVIIVEAVMHQISHDKRFAGMAILGQPQMDELVNESADRMMNSAVFGQIIILIVYLPIFTLEGIEGKMFKPMAQTVAFALLGAFLLSVTYIPMMSALVLSKKVRHEANWSDRIMDRLGGYYKNALTAVLRHPKLVLGSALLLFGFSIFVLTTLGGEFIPALEEGDFAVDTRVLTGSNLNTTIANTQKAAHILKTRFPEVEKVVTKIGSGEVPTDPMPMEASDMMVILRDKKEWTSAASFDELSEKMSEALKAVPGITAGFQYPVQMRFNELMTGARQDVVCKIFGEDLDTLAHYAQQLGRLAGQVEGARNLYVEAVSGLPQVTITYNRKAIAEYGLTISAVNRVVNTALAGQSSGMVFEGEKRFDLVVRVSPEHRKNLSDIANLLVSGRDGLQIPLQQVADVKIQSGPSQIQREDAKRRIIVGFNVNGRDVASIVNELQMKASRDLRLPAGYYVTYGGSFENLNAAKQRLMVAVPVSLVLIFILLFFAFGSIRDTLLIYSAIPLSAVGGILFLAVRGMPFSISAGIGFIALFGVAVLNGIVLVAEFNRIRAAGHGDMLDAVITGASNRLRPVLMTAFVASLGFLPMAFSHGSGAEVQRPLATVVIGGLLIATMLTLFVLPMLYMLFENGIRHRNAALGLLFPVLLTMLSGCNGKTSEQANSNSGAAPEDVAVLTPEQIANAGVQVDTPQVRTVSKVLRLNGKIDVPPQNIVSVSAPMGGYLKSTSLLPGSPVKKGQILAVLEDQQFIQLQQDYLTVKARLAYLQTDYNRQKALNASKSSSDKAVQQAESELAGQQVALRAMEEKLQLIGINPDRLSAASISQSVSIRSSINGFVSSVNVNIGRYVSPNDVLFELVNPSDMHLALKVFEKDLSKIKVGQTVMAYSNNDPDKKYACQIILIGKTLSSDRTAEVHCHFQQESPALAVGTFMNADVELDSQSLPALPEDAIVSFEDQQFLFLREGKGKYRMVRVRTGETENGYTQILDPARLNGRPVVITGAYSLLMSLKNKADE